MAFQQIFDKMRPRRVTLQYSDGGSQRTLLKIDCTLAEEISLDAQATMHEIEDGSEIADHVIKRGRVLSIDGIISDTPITFSGAMVGNTAGAVGGAIGGPVGSITTAAGVVMANLALAGSSRASKAALDIFEEIYAKRTLLTIVAGLATYGNMIMERFSAPRNAGNAGALVFKASFRQVTIITGQSVEIPRAAKSAGVKDLSATERQQGMQQGKALDKAKSDKAASWAYRLIWGNN